MSAGMAYLLAFMVCAAGAALNVAVYAANGEAINLGAAVFCGALAIFNLAKAVAN